MQHCAVPGAPQVEDLGDIELEAIVELGRTTIPLRRARELAVGDAIRMPRLAGEAFSLSLNGHPYGEGEIVVTNEQLYLRLTRMEEPVESRRESSGETS